MLCNKLDDTSICHTAQPDVMDKYIYISQKHHTHISFGATTGTRDVFPSYALYSRASNIYNKNMMTCVCVCVWLRFFCGDVK